MYIHKIFQVAVSSIAIVIYAHNLRAINYNFNSKTYLNIDFRAV